MKSKRNASIVGLAIIAIIIVVVLVLVAKHRAEAPASSSVQSATSTATAAGNLVSIAPTDVSIAATTPLDTVTGSYPQFTQTDVAFNKKIADGITGDAADFTKNASADYQAHLATGGDEFQKEFASGNYYTFDVSYDVVQSNADYVSLIVREEGFTGGAHPFHNLFTFNYDVKNQKEVTLASLFPNDPNYLTTVSSESRAALTTKLTAAAEETTLDDNTKSMMMDGTDPTTPDNFDAFTFTGSTITVYFGEYQVAPYVYGEQSISLER